MKIALDFDETITADPILWEQFILLAKQRLHEIVIVTYRPDIIYNTSQNQDIEDFAKKNNIQIIYTGGKQKASFYNADIWIDDRPELIPVPSILAGMLKGCKKIGEY